MSKKNEEPGPVPHADWLGSDRMQTDASSRSVTDNNAYAPFGEPYTQTGNGEISFTGQNKDTVWLQYDFLMRQYDPKQGRWISPDPAGMAAVDPTNPQSWNRYAYVGNNPLIFTDPLGLLLQCGPGYVYDGTECRPAQCVMTGYVYVAGLGDICGAASYSGPFVTCVSTRLHHFSLLIYNLLYPH